MKCASVKCEVRVRRAQCEVVKKVFAWRCIAPGSCAGHVLGQQHCNSFAQSTHARAGWRTAHASSIDKKSLIEGSLEVKLPTIWTDEKQRREEKDQKRKE